MWRRGDEVKRDGNEIVFVRTDDSLSPSSVDDLTKECLGFAEDVYEHDLVGHRCFSTRVMNVRL